MQDLCVGILIEPSDASHKRQRIADLTQKYGIWIVEDVPYPRLRYRGEDLPTLLDLAPKRVIQCPR